MSYEVKTAVFEGPLDLLLALITRRQVDITSVSLSDLVTEYLGFLDAMRDMDLEVTSEFLLIASTLIQLKARFLLPDDEPIDLDEELALMEERDRLLSRLLACVTFKDVAAVFGHRLAGEARFVPRIAGLDQPIAPASPQLALAATAADLARMAEKVFAASGREPDLDHLELELPSVPAAMEDLRHRVNAAMETDFETLTGHCRAVLEVAAYFLALLELARWGLVAVSQEHRDAAIVVRARPDARVGELVSEWDRP